MNYNNIVGNLNKFFLMLALFTVSFTMSSCYTSNENIEGDTPIIDPEEPAEPTDVLPILNWGESQSEIKAMQRNLVINVENDTLLRFANNSKTLFIDYFFKSNNLVSVSMTQANIANVKDVIN